MTFNNENIDFFKLDLLDKLLRRADVVIRPRIPSTTLRSAMRQRIDLSNNRRAKGDLFIPHFWAVMVHDGTRSFGPKAANFLVYFVNEADDPRKPTPERAADVRRLTREEFQAGVAENRRLEQLNPGGGPQQHMIVVKTPRGRPGRVAAKPARPFFSEGGRGFESQVDNIVFREFDAFVLRNIVTERISTRIQL